MATDIEDELLPESQLPGLDRLWWRLQLLSGVALTVIGIYSDGAQYLLGWGSEKRAGVLSEPFLTSPVPGSVLLGLALGLIVLAFILVLPAASTYFQTQELQRRGVPVGSALKWSVLALICTELWPLYWWLLWKFRGYRQGVSTEVSE